MLGQIFINAIVIIIFFSRSRIFYYLYKIAHNSSWYSLRQNLEGILKKKEILKIDILGIQ